MCLKSIWYLVSAFLERKEKTIQIKLSSDWQKAVKAEATLRQRDLTQYAPYAFRHTDLHWNNSNRWKKSICNHLKEFLLKCPSFTLPAIRYFMSLLLWWDQPAERSLTYKPCLKSSSYVTAAARLQRLPKLSPGFSKKIKKNCNQATGSITLPATRCQKQMGCLFIASGTGCRSVLRHFSVGVHRAPANTVHEAVPLSIFTSIVTIKVNIPNLKERDIISETLCH